MPPKWYSFAFLAGLPLAGDLNEYVDSVADLKGFGRFCFQPGAVLSDGAAFCFGGDIVFDMNKENLDTIKAQWELWHSILKMENSLPMHYCLGNHDLVFLLTAFLL
jgi:hypothetical protein